MPFRRTRYVEERPTRACSRRGATTGGLDPPQDAPRRAREGPLIVSGAPRLRSSSGSLAMLAAMRRASSRVNCFAAARQA